MGLRATKAENDNLLPGRLNLILKVVCSVRMDNLADVGGIIGN